MTAGTISAPQVLAPVGRPEHERLLETSWEGRGRAIRGQELALELAMTAGFLLAAGALALSGAPGSVHMATAAVVVAYAIAARAEFPIGNGAFIPTELFLVPMFVVAPAQFVPLLVFAALVLAAVSAAIAGSARADRVVFCAGDAMHALGPALVIVTLAERDATEAGALVIAAAFAAQILVDLASSSVHELVTLRARPRLHLRIMAEIWGVDAALGTIGLLTAVLATDAPWAAVAPLPLVVLLHAQARDRARSISTAHERRVALEQERDRRQAVVEQLAGQVEFLHDVSHELRTPVTIARGHIDMLLRAREANPALLVSLDELERIDRMIGRLLVLARAGERGSFHPEALDAEAVLEDRFVRWSDTVPRAWQLGDLAPGTIVADGDALDTTLDALLENAVKHTSRSEHIGLSSHAESGVLVIEIADTGDGIPAEALGRIFDRFTRADTERNAQIGGVGLGLATVDAVARAHGGRCSVESSAAGSTFTLRLPLFEPAA
jgi:two-component system OmpR family sensor kinase